MSTFEFVIVAYSIILGVGLATLFGNLAWLGRERARVRFSAIHGGWVFVTSLWLLSAWWDAYALRSRAVWTWVDFLLLMAAGAFIVFQAFLVTPAPGDVADDEAIDLTQFWIHQRTAFLGAGSCYWTVQVLNNLREMTSNPDIPLGGVVGQGVVLAVLLGSSIWRPERAVHAVVISLFVLMSLGVRLFTPAGVLGGT